MKKLVLLLITAILAFQNSGTAQTSMKVPNPRATDDTVIYEKITIEGDKRTTEIVKRDMGTTTEVVIIQDRSTTQKSKKKSRRIGIDGMIDFGFNNLSNSNIITGADGDDFLSLNTAKSVNLAIYPYMVDFGIARSRVFTIITGIGFDWNNYRFEDGWTLVNENGQTVPSDKYRTGGVNTLSKSKLMTIYANVPLIFNVNIPINGSYRKHVYLSAGVIGGIKLGSHTKIKSNDGDKAKDHDSFNLNLLRYDLTLRAGYRGVGIFCNYQMTPLFENGKGAKVYPYDVGVSFTF